MFRTALFSAALASSALFAVPAWAGPAEDATAAVTTVLDKFNGGDVNAFLAAHQDGAIIVDEFAPYLWGGPGSAQQWVASYGKYVEQMGDSGGRVDYGKPLQAVSAGIRPMSC